MADVPEGMKEFTNTSEEPVLLFSGIPVRPDETVLLNEADEELNAGLIDDGVLSGSSKSSTTKKEQKDE